jgi:hypothetical protein
MTAILIQSSGQLWPIWPSQHGDKISKDKITYQLFTVSSHASLSDQCHGVTRHRPQTRRRSSFDVENPVELARPFHDCLSANKTDVLCMFMQVFPLGNARQSSLPGPSRRAVHANNISDRVELYCSQAILKH